MLPQKEASGEESDEIPLTKKARKVLSDDLTDIPTFSLGIEELDEPETETNTQTYTPLTLPLTEGEVDSLLDEKISTSTKKKHFVGPLILDKLKEALERGKRIQKEIESAGVVWNCGHYIAFHSDKGQVKVIDSYSPSLSSTLEVANLFQKNGFETEIVAQGFQNCNTSCGVFASWNAIERLTSKNPQNFPPAAWFSKAQNLIDNRGKTHPSRMVKRPERLNL